MWGKAVIVGIGNPLRGDDGFGPALIERLQGRIGATCIDAGSAPENYAGRIVKEQPDTILLVDVAHLDLAPGQYRILRPAEILQCGITTHDMSCRMLIEFLDSQTRADIFMLGIQPQAMSLGEGMSKRLTEALDEIENLIREGIMHETHLIEPVIQGISAHAQREDAKQVLKVRLRVGELTGVKKESFTNTFEILAKGTLLEDAELELDFFPGGGIEVISFDID